MPKTTKKLKKETVKNKKPLKKAVTTKKQLKKTKKTTKKVSLTSGKKLLEFEIGMLDAAQNNLFELIANKPDPRDVEAVRLYVDNVFHVMNRVVTLIMDVKNSLIKKDIPQAITETYNSPA